MSIQDNRQLYIKQRNTIITLLKEIPFMSFDELKRRTNYSTSSLTQILKTLSKAHIIYALEDHQYTLNKNYTNALCIAIVRDFKRVHIIYRVYNAIGEIRIERDIIKKYISISDIYDIIDTVLASYSHIRTIGISIPGIIENGCLHSSALENFEDLNVLALLKQKYTQAIILENDVNTAVLGLYMRMPEYENVAVLFQPVSNMAGSGLVINGKLITGKSHVAGEVQFLPIDFSVDDPAKLLNSPEGFEELISKYLQCIIALVNPEAVGIVCNAVKDYTPIIERLKAIFPNAEDLPEIVPIDNLYEDNLSGIYALCKEREKE